MNKPQFHKVSDQEIQTFKSGGAAVIRNVLDSRWLETISKGMALNKTKPTEKGVYYCKDEQSGESFFHDALTIRHNPYYEKYITESPIGSIAAQMMGLPAALAFYTTVFFRTGGTKERTPWHQDQTYWSAESKHGLSIWTCLDPVPQIKHRISIVCRLWKIRRVFLVRE